MNKLTLSDWIENIPEIYVLGIHSHLEDYRLAFVLNKIMHTTFVASIPLLSAQRGKHIFVFSYFSYQSPSTTNTIYLINNLSVSASTQPGFSFDLSPLSGTQTFFIKSKPKWPFILLSIDLEWLESFKKIQKSNYISATHLIDFQQLSKLEKESVTNLFYEN